MSNRREILRELDEASDQNGLNDVFDKLDSYAVAGPRPADTALLIARLKPVLAQETTEAERQQFKAALIATRQRSGLPLILQLVGPQSALMSRWFVALTLALFSVGVALTDIFAGTLAKYLVTVSPLLGLMTLFYQYRAQVYKVEEMEAACRYSPAQIATARIVVVLGYNILLGTAATLAEWYYNAVVWGLVLNWLAPLLLILGIALFTSLKLGITGGCLAAGAVWVAQISLAEGGSLLRVVLPELAAGSTDTISIVLGVGLIYFSVIGLQPEVRAPRTR